MALKSPYSRNAPVGPMYRMSLRGATITAVTGQATGTLANNVFSFQWVSTNKICIVSAVEAHFQTSTVFTTAQTLQFGMYNVRSYTAPDTSGTIATFATAAGIQTGKFDSNFAASNFVTAGQINIANSTATGLTAGTGVVDQYPVHVWTGIGVATLGVFDGFTGYEADADYGDNQNTQSLWYRNNEGFVIIPMITLGAGGGMVISVTVEWAEMGAQFY